MRMMVMAICVILSVNCSAINRVVVVEKFDSKSDSGATMANLESLHSRMTDAIINSRKFDVVERVNLSKVLKEHSIVDAGMTEGQAPESNKLMAAGYVMYGEVLRWRTDVIPGDGYVVGKSVVELQLRFSNCETGKILASKTVEGAGTKSSAPVDDVEHLREQAVDAAVADAVRKVVNSLVELAYPVKVLSVNSRFVTVNLTEEQCAEGETFEVFELGDELIDEDTGRSLGFDEDLIGVVIASRPGPKTTKCMVVEPTKLDEIKKGMVLRRMKQKKKNSIKKRLEVL